MIPADAVTGTVIFQDDGIYGLRERQNRVGIITGTKVCRITGRNFFVKVEGYNLDRLVREDQIIAYAHPSVQWSETKTTAEAAVFA